MEIDSTIVEDCHDSLPNRTLDFGVGFYTTAYRDQAIDFAGIVMRRRRVATQFISVYDFDMMRAEKELDVLRFPEPDEDWFDYVCQNRQATYVGKSYDLVIGPVANDKVYATIGLYESGFLNKTNAIESFKVNPLFDQVVMKTERALALLTYREAFDPREGSR
jgi:hypothetical protein